MYLSCLLIDVGDNPDRPRPGRLWLRNLYHVHQRLCMAFPSVPRKKHDPNFLAPFVPKDFSDQVHVRREEEAGFLFRVDPQPTGAVILVQSAVNPDWEYAFHNASYLLGAKPEIRPFEPRYSAGERLLFRLVANPTRRLSKHSLERNGEPVEKKWIGKRVPVPHDQLLEWLAEWRFRKDGRDEPSGFRIDKEHTRVQPGYVYLRKSANRQRNPVGDGPQEEPASTGRRLFSARYDGILDVTDPEKFRSTLIRGVGPGKAFGFGLLSVAPCHAPAAADAK